MSYYSRSSSSAYSSPSYFFEQEQEEIPSGRNESRKRSYHSCSVTDYSEISDNVDLFSNDDKNQNQNIPKKAKFHDDSHSDVDQNRKEPAILSPASPGYSQASLGYSQASPGYSADSPVYNPAPGYSQASLGYRPAPGYSQAYPGYSAAPGYSQASPGYSPDSPVYSPAPGYSQASPGYSPDSPVYSPAPGYSQASPENTPALEHSPASRVVHVPFSKWSPDSPVYSPAPGYSQPSAGYSPAPGYSSGSPEYSSSPRYSPTSPVYSQSQPQFSDDDVDDAQEVVAHAQFGYQGCFLPPTPPSTPEEESIGSKKKNIPEKRVEDLPSMFLMTVCSSPILAAEDRVHIQLVSQFFRNLMTESYSKVKQLRVAVTECDDDRFSSSFIIRTLRLHDQLRSVTLCLNSSVNDRLCRSTELFRALAECQLLKELTLLLTQLRRTKLNEGLVVLGGALRRIGDRKGLRKLVLVNSTALDDTMKIVSRWFPDLESLGLINCWFLEDSAVEPVFRYCRKLKTLNVRASRKITSDTLIDFLRWKQRYRRDTRSQIKIYLDGTMRKDGNRIRPEDFKDFTRGLDVKVVSWKGNEESTGAGGSFLDDSAVRHSWEYCSDNED